MDWICEGEREEMGDGRVDTGYWLREVRGMRLNKHDLLNMHLMVGGGWSRTSTLERFCFQVSISSSV